MNYDWWQEFTSQASGLGTTFTPAIIGFAATLDSLSSVLDARGEIVPIAAAARHLSAGVDVPRRAASSIATPGSGRRARTDSSPHAASSSGASCGSASSPAPSTGSSSPTSTAGCSTTGPTEADARLSSGARGVLLAAGLYAVFGALLVAVNIVFDYAKVRLVVEDRRSAVGALIRRARLPRTASGPRVRPLRAERAGASWCCLRCGRSSLPAQEAPGCRCGWRSRAPGLPAGAAGLKLQFMASQTALFQRRSRTPAIRAPRRSACRWPRVDRVR